MADKRKRKRGGCVSGGAVRPEIPKPKPGLHVKKDKVRNGGDDVGGVYDREIRLP